MMSAVVEIAAAEERRLAEALLDHRPAAPAAVVHEPGGRIAFGAVGQHQLHHQRGHEGRVGPVEPEQVLDEIGICGRGHQPPLAMPRDEVVADRAAFPQHEVAVGDHRRDPHGMQRLVFVGREPVVRAPLVELEQVVELQLLAQPYDAFGLRRVQVMNREHGRAFSPEIRPARLRHDRTQGNRVGSEPASVQPCKHRRHADLHCRGRR